MHMLAIIVLLMFGFSTWNFTVLWRAGGCPLNENSQFASLEKYKLTNSYPVGVKELNCHCVINDWIIVRWYKKAIIYYISTNWLLAQLVLKEWAITTKTCNFFVRWFIKLKKIKHIFDQTTEPRIYRPYWRKQVWLGFMEPALTQDTLYIVFTKFIQWMHIKGVAFVHPHFHSKYFAVKFNKV
jgi:hypothetical protein